MSVPSPLPAELWHLEAPSNALAWLPDSRTFAAAIGDGTVVLGRVDLAKPLPIEVDGTPLALVAMPDGFAVGTDTGHLLHLSPEGDLTPLAHFPGKFLEHLCYIPKPRNIAVAIGKQVALVAAGKPPVLLPPCPSTVAGLALSPLGPRLAASHYNGASIFDITRPKAEPRKLEWKGSHLALTYAPNGKWLISTMQERALHLWRLADGMDLQMRGYPGTITQLAWAAGGTLLATNGGTGVPLWNFTDPDRGPAGQQARVVADSGNPELLVTAVALHPHGPFAAVGYADGLVLLTHLTDDRAILVLAPGNHGQVSHLSFAPDGLHLLMGSTGGLVGLVDFKRFR